jgi:DNA-binding GntR family transcriptional regulator
MTESRILSPEKIAEDLSFRIIRGSFLPGEKLRQDHIAEEFQVSHVPVREAFLRLVAKGLAVSKPRHGVRVAPLDPDGQRELKVMRLALEPVALIHSVPHLTPAQIATAEEARRICDASENICDWEEANRAFHTATMAGCAMPRLLEEIANLQLLAARYILVHYKDRWRRRIDPDHHALMAALRRKDPRMAASILERHLSRLN